MSNQVYATYQQLKNYMYKSSINPQLTDDDDRLIRFARQVSKEFSETVRRKFMPYRQTRFYNLRNTTIYSNYDCPLPALILDEDLLEVFTLKTNDNADTITDFALKKVNSYNDVPYDRIELSSFSGQFLETVPQKSQSVDGLWGYHDNPNDMWELVDTVQDNPLSISSTTVTVPDANLFSTQNLIRFGDDNTGEFAFIQSKNIDGTDTLTVQRGANGTTAVSQALNTNIYKFIPMHDVNLIVTIAGVAAYTRKDNLGGPTDRRIITDGAILLPSEIAEEVRQGIKRYRKYTR